jgi:hypothetical protein
MKELFLDGFDLVEIENDYFEKKLYNNKEDLEMSRIFIQSKFKKI